MHAAAKSPGKCSTRLGKSDHHNRFTRRTGGFWIGLSLDLALCRCTGFYLVEVRTQVLHHHVFLLQLFAQQGILQFEGLAGIFQRFDLATAFEKAAKDASSLLQTVVRFKVFHARKLPAKLPVSTRTSAIVLTVWRSKAHKQPYFPASVYRIRSVRAQTGWTTHPQANL